MRGKITVVLGFLVVVQLPEPASAQTVYSDGLNHDVSAPSQAIELQNDGTTLTVLPGASITGSPGFQSGNALTGGNGTAINLFGGNIDGASIAYFPTGGFGSAGIFTNGSLTAFGGTVTGGGALIMDGAGAGLFSQGGTAVIGGGSFLGGTGGGPGSFFAGGSGQILGGTFRGGDASNLGIVGGVGLVSGRSNLSVSGGIFEGGGHGLVSGGGGAALGFNLGNLTISGGTFQAALSSSGFTNNPAVGATMGGQNLIMISGGEFDAAGGGSDGRDALYLSGSGFARADISGGVFSGSIELSMSEVASTTFIGSNLLYDPGTGFLTGTLEDGSAIDNYIRLDPPTPYYYGHAVDGSETLMFGPLSTPEPSSIVMLLLGAGSVAIAATRMRRRAAGLPPKAG